MDFGYPVLTILIAFPLIAACGLFFLRAPQVVRYYTMAVSLIECLLAVPLLTGFKLNAEFQFVETDSTGSTNGDSSIISASTGSAYSWSS